jgi:hypothetical protein
MRVSSRGQGIEPIHPPPRAGRRGRTDCQPRRSLRRRGAARINRSASQPSSVPRSRSAPATAVGAGQFAGRILAARAHARGGRTDLARRRCGAIAWQPRRPVECPISIEAVGPRGRSRGDTDVSLSEDHPHPLVWRSRPPKRRPANGPRARYTVRVRRQMDTFPTAGRHSRDVDMRHGTSQLPGADRVRRLMIGAQLPRAARAPEADAAPGCLPSVTVPPAARSYP